MARLILQTAEGQQAIELRGVNSLGRHPSNTIQLLDKIVSKEHCIIEHRVDHWVLRDLGSLNGTYINNERVKGEGRLKHGDEISLGATRGRFEDVTPRTVQMGAWSPQSQQISSATPGAHPPSVHQPQPSTPYPQHPQPVSSGAFTPYTTQGNPASIQQHSTAMPAYPPNMPGMPIATPQGNSQQSYFHPPSMPRVDMQEASRHIGTQISAIEKGFAPFERVAPYQDQLRADYEKLRLTHELSREIATERDTSKLLNKILASIFKFIGADRGVIFLRNEQGELAPRAMLRRDGSTAAISVSSTILNHVVKERAAVLTHDAAMDFAGSKGKSMILNRISSAIVAPLMTPSQQNGEVLGVLWLDAESIAQFQPKDLDVVLAIAHQAAMFIEISILGLKVENEIVTRERFRRLFSPNIADRVISGALEVKPGGQLVEECTVFNSDIRGFTQMSEGTKPEVIVEMLNEYFELMVDTIFQFEGTLDKFMGDGIMAMWGAPVAHPDDAVRSVRCALEMGEVLGKYNRRRMDKSQSPIAIGIGVHSGPVVAGYIGSSKALSYTVIGDVANTSARLCSVATPGQIVISEMTYARLQNRFEVEELSPAKVKGKEKPLRIFNVLRERPAVQVHPQFAEPLPSTDRGRISG